MSQATLTDAPYTNSNLFSGYYLNERVHELDAWDCNTEAREAFEAIRDLYETEKDILDSYDEDPLRRHWIDEVLSALGYETLSETPILDARGSIDRTLYNTGDERMNAAMMKADGEYAGMYGQSLSILEAKQWDADFTERFSEGWVLHLFRKIERLSKKQNFNLSLLDHLGTYDDGPTLAEIGFAQPPAGVAESVLSETTDTRTKLGITGVSFERESPNTLTVSAEACYKPDDPEDYDTDSNGYRYVGPDPALTITDLTEREADLIEAFVPVAIEEAKSGSFAGFRRNATTTISPIDRLRGLTLPDPDDVADGLERYLETKERAAELDEKIERTDELIDEIVYELYGLTDEEIEIVEEAVGKD